MPSSVRLRKRAKCRYFGLALTYFPAGGSVELPVGMTTTVQYNRECTGHRSRECSLARTQRLVGFEGHMIGKRRGRTFEWPSFRVPRFTFFVKKKNENGADERNWVTGETRPRCRARREQESEIYGSAGARGKNESWLLPAPPPPPPPRERTREAPRLGNGDAGASASLVHCPHSRSVNSRPPFPLAFGRPVSLPRAQLSPPLYTLRTVAFLRPSTLVEPGRPPSSKHRTRPPFNPPTPSTGIRVQDSRRVANFNATVRTSDDYLRARVRGGRRRRSSSKRRSCSLCRRSRDCLMGTFSPTRRRTGKTPARSCRRHWQLATGSSSETGARSGNGAARRHGTWQNGRTDRSRGGSATGLASRCSPGV